MAAFTLDEVDWRLPDVCALVGGTGILVASMVQAEILSSWLVDRGYTLQDLDFIDPIDMVLKQMAAMFRWEHQFGYSLEDGRGDLNAIRDGFDFPAVDGGRIALIIRNADAPHVDRPWLLALLSIAAEHSRYHLALGSRFLTVLPLSTESGLVGSAYEHCLVGTPWEFDLNSAKSDP